MKLRNWFEAVAGTLLVALLALTVWSFQQQQARHAELHALILSTRPASAPAAERPTRPVSLSAVAPAPAASDDQLRADLRAIIREELGEFAAASEGSDASEANEEQADPTELDPESFDENVRQFERATTLVQTALSSRVWGDQQANEFRTIRSKLTPDQYQGLLRQILPAINSQEVRADTSGPMF